MFPTLEGPPHYGMSLRGQSADSLVPSDLEKADALARQYSSAILVRHRPSLPSFYLHLLQTRDQRVGQHSARSHCGPSGGVSPKGVAWRDADVIATSKGDRSYSLGERAMPICLVRCLFVCLNWNFNVYSAQLPWAPW